MWSLKLRGIEILKSPTDNIPSATAWSSLLKQLYLLVKEEYDDEDEMLSDLTGEIIRNAPLKGVSPMLSVLQCYFWRSPTTGEVDLNMLKMLKNDNKKTICGYVFKKDDLVWNCRNCGKDPTCVQCDRCFNESSALHVNHEVFFHRADGNGGGCCDCGDKEAWASSGSCPRHGIEDCCNADPSAIIPVELKRGLDAVLRGLVAVLVSYCTCVARGYEKWGDNKFAGLKKLRRDIGSGHILVGRLHNDDSHTFDEVIDALRAVGFDQVRAEAITAAVDGQGHAALVGHPSVPSGASKLFGRVLGEDRKLLYSVLPVCIANRENNVVAALQWLHTQGLAHSGLMRIITDALLLPLDSLFERATVMTSEDFVVEPTERNDPQTRITVDPIIESVSPEFIFVDTLNNDSFPNRIAYLEELSLPDRLPVSFRRPFEICPRIGLALIMIASPYVPKSFKKAINNLVVVFQQDARFKEAFSELLVMLYPALVTLYSIFVGTHEHNLLSTSVQMFTASSIVDNLSTDGVARRLLTPFASHEQHGVAALPSSSSSAEQSRPAPSPFAISTMLVQCLRVFLDLQGCRAGFADDQFLLSAGMRHRRGAMVMRDIEYVFENTVAAMRTMSGVRDPKTIEEWLRVCFALQGIDKHARRAFAHVEREDDQWQYAMNLALEIDAVGKNFITYAMFPSAAPTTWLETVASQVRSEPATASASARDALIHSLRLAVVALTAWQDMQATPTAVKPTECACCGFFACFSCPECHQITYCSEICQRADIHNHSSSCLPRSTRSPPAADTRPTEAEQPADIPAVPARPSAAFARLAAVATAAGTASSPPTAVKTDESMFFSGREPIRFLGHSVSFPGIRRYHVSFSPVSIHLPLQRFIAQLVTNASYGAVDLTGLIAFPAVNQAAETTSWFGFSVPVRCLTALIDFPMRCLSLAAQVRCGLWRRNGITVESMMMNYSCAPLSKTFFRADLTCIQIAILSLGSDSVLALAIDRFELTMVLESMNLSSSGPNLKEYKGPLLAEMLRSLIHLITYTPVIMRSEKPAEADGLRLAVKREIAHIVLAGFPPAAEQRAHGLTPASSSGGGVSFSYLHKVREIVATSSHVSDAMIRDVAGDVCHSRGNGGDSTDKAVFEPGDVAFELFDPEYISLSLGEAHRAIDRVRLRRKTLSNTPATSSSRPPFPRPLLQPAAIPTANPAFDSVRSMLYRPMMFTLLERSVLLCLDKKEDVEAEMKRCRHSVCCRVLHLLTLQLLCAYYVTTSTGSHEKYTQAFASAFANDGCGAGFFAALLSLWKSDVFFEDELYREGLDWALRELGVRLPHLCEKLRAVGVPVSVQLSSAQAAAANTSEGVEMDVSVDVPTAARPVGLEKEEHERKMLLAKKRAAAQKRALASMKKQADAFSMSIADSDSPDRSIRPSGQETKTGLKMDPSVNEDEKISAEYEDVGVCILCKEKNSEALGHLCFIHHTKLVSNAVSDSCVPHSLRPSFIIEGGSELEQLEQHTSSAALTEYLKCAFRVVAVAGCSVYADRALSTRDETASTLLELPYPEKLDPSLIVHKLQQGDHVLGDRRRCRWLHIMEPVVGWCTVYSDRQSDCNTSDISEEDKHHPGTITLLSPVLPLVFSRHGAVRTLVSSCGHYMHFRCWLSWKTRSAPSNNIPDQDVFSCPLCKSVCNNLLPHTPPSLSSVVLKSGDGVAGDRLAPWISDDVRDQDEAKASHNVHELLFSDPQQNRLISETDTSAQLDEPLMYMPATDLFVRGILLSMMPAWVPDRPAGVLAEEHVTAYHATVANVVMTHMFADITRLLHMRDDEYAAADTGLKRGGGGGEECVNMLRPTSVAVQLFLNLRFYLQNTKSEIIDSDLAVLLPGEPIHPASSREASNFVSPGIFAGKLESDSSECRLLDINVCSKDDYVLMLLTMPRNSVYTLPYPKRDRLVAILKRCKECGLHLKWWHDQPLLIADLYIVAVAAAAKAVDISAMSSILAVLAISRLVQILVEPVSTGIFDPHFPYSNASVHASARESDKHNSKRRRLKFPAFYSSSSSGSSNLDQGIGELASALQIFRTAIDVSFYQEQTSLQSSLPLLQHVLSSWLPFLEYTRTLLVIAHTAIGLQQQAGNAKSPLEEYLDVMRNVSSSQGAASCSIESIAAMLAAVDAYLALLCLPNFESICKNQAVCSLGRRWVNQMKEFLGGYHVRRTAASSSLASLGARGSSRGCGKDILLASEQSQQSKESSSSGFLQEKVAESHRATRSSTSAAASSAAERDFGFLDEHVIGDEQCEMERQNQHSTAADESVGGGGDNIDERDSHSSEDEPYYLDDDEEDEGDNMAGAIIDGIASIPTGTLTVAEAIRNPAMLQMLQMLGLSPDGQADMDVITMLNAMTNSPGDAYALLAQAFRSSRSSDDSRGDGPEQQYTRWPLVGVDPANAMVDGVIGEMFSSPELTAIHSAPPLVGSVTGASNFYGLNGETLADGFMCDRSHMGLELRQILRSPFVELPQLYTRIYQLTKAALTRRSTGRSNIIDRKMRPDVDDPCVCLVCGQILNAGNRLPQVGALRSALQSFRPGECTLHARDCGAGVGVFLLVEKNIVLLLSHSKSAYHHALYLDSNGEAGDCRRAQNRPMFLSKRRLKRLVELYVGGLVPAEVARLRNSVDRIVRLNWF